MPDYATNIALIKNGIVENIIWGMFYSSDAYAQEGYMAIPVDDLGLHIGDTFSNGRFYDQNGDPVLTIYEYHAAEIAELDEFIINELYNLIIEDAELEDL